MDPTPQPAGTTPLPPRPRTVFRIGVTGHRPNRLDPTKLEHLEVSVERLLRAALDSLQAQAGLQAEPPRLRVICALAEGSDRLVARTALRLGSDLQVVLPFLRQDYEADFPTQHSLAEFRDLLIQASAVIELDTQTRDRAFGYRDAGDAVLTQSDLLLAIWDGKPAAGVGGTVDVMEHADSRGIPVLVIDPLAPDNISLHNEPEPCADAPDPFAALTAIITSVSAAQPSHFFWSEPWPARTSTAAYFLLRLLGDHKFAFAPAPDSSGAAADIRTLQLRRYFHWTDAQAVHYGERTRSAGILLQTFASVAVLSALLRIPAEAHRHLMQALSVTELTSILVLLGIAYRVSRSNWHERWLFYRSMAEQVRSLDILAPIGQCLPAPPVIGFVREEGGHTDFAHRYLQSIERELGLLPAVADESFLHGRLNILKQVVLDQAAFHVSASRRYERVERLLHGTGFTLFVAAVLLCLYEIVHTFVPNSEGSSWAATASAILPALGAAAASIAAQSELKRLANRSAAMGRTLLSLLPQIEALDARPERPTMRALVTLSRRISDILTSEVRDWRVLVSAKPPELPT